MRPIRDAFFDQRPDPLTRIQLRCIGGHADQRDALRNLQSGGAMRGRAVPDQKDALTCGRMLFGELREESLHTRGVESRQHQPERAPSPRVSRRIEPEPFVALINLSQRALSLWRPDAAQHRLETKASLVFAPDFYCVRGVCLLKGVRLELYLFLNSACSCVDARRLFAGRGT